MSPLFSAIFGWLLLGETLDPIQVAAVLLTLAGVVYSQTGSRPIVDSQPEARPLEP